MIPGARDASTRRVLVALLWPAALVAAVYLVVGRWGFNPTDEGLLQSGSYRILCGQIPHRDWISPRPVFSYLVHTLDFAIPGPLFEVSRMIAIAEFALYAVLFAWLVYRLPPWRWGWLRALGAAGSMFVNMHVFLVTSWYTVDGLLLVAAGLLLVREGVERERASIVRIGFLCLGLSLITKQSFFLGPILGWMLLAPRVRAQPSLSRRGVELAWTVVAVAAPALAYGAWISCAGGFRAMATQLTSGSIVYGRELVTTLAVGRERVALAALLIGELALLAAGRLAMRRQSAIGDFLVRCGLSALFIAVPLAGGLTFFGSSWGIRLVWMFAAFLAFDSRARGAVDVTGLSVLGASWMAMLTWGLPVPNLMGGTLILFVLDRTWRDAPAHPWHGAAWLRSTMASAAALFVAGSFVHARSRNTYLDATAERLTASLERVSPEFGDIRTNPTTAKYMEQIAECVRRFPARSVAVLPANAAVYPALRLRDPFPIDWTFPQDLRGSEERLLDAVDALNREGDYLVLFQTQSGSTLASLSALPDASLATPIFHYDDERRTPLEIYARLNGRRIAVGSFIAVYSR
jgi:hypothetical protein